MDAISNDPDRMILLDSGKYQQADIEEYKLGHRAQQAHAQAIDAVVNPVGVFAF